MTRRLLTASAAAALVLGLAACGDDTGGTITDPPSTIATGASDDGGTSDGGGAGGSTGEASDDGGTTKAAPDIPAPDPADYPGMDEHTDEGAEQAFKFYIDSVFWGFETGDSAAIKEMTAADCNSCTGVIDQIDDHGKAGEYWSHVSLEAGELRSEPYEDFEISVIYSFVASAHTEPDLDSDDTEDVPKALYGTAGALNWQDDHWELGDVSITNEDA
ncbi:DUF6318 family protein [Brachybacterium rhamnosum]|uniref:DUF6318 family protein n=1 Tax=Brachybacterium rhamnosum TaxID=173361 RepID=A0ABW4PV06_9MICO